MFSTEERVKILREIIYSAERIEVSRTAKKLKLSKGLVSKYFEILVQAKILRRKESGFLVNNNSSVRGIKIMLNVLRIPRIFTRYGFVKAVGLYGSSAKGTNTSGSDIDL